MLKSGKRIQSEITDCWNRGNELQPERTDYLIRGNELLIRGNGLHNSILRFTFAISWKINMSIQGFRSCPARLFCNDFQLKIINIIHFKVRTLKFYSCSNFFQHVIGPSFRATVRSRHIYIPPKTGRSYILPWFVSMTQACPNSKTWNKGLVNFITGNSSVLCWDVHVWFRRFCRFVRRTRNLHISCREFSPLSHLGFEPRPLS